MPATDKDTICGAATPPGTGGIAVIRISGERAHSALSAVFCPAGDAEMKPRYLHHGYVKDGGETVDEAMAVIFNAPSTYTREDMAELHVHGGSLHVQKAIGLLCRHGVRPAQPGEFTKRAFYNGRIDLSQAEALMDFIGAATELSSRSALRAMEGDLSRLVKDLSAKLKDVMAGIEAGLDFPDETADERHDEQLVSELTYIAGELKKLESSFRTGRVLREGFPVAIVGRPNVGKSSLLNALLGRERAIVTDIPGTTRDIIEECADIGGLLVRFADTAGLRPAADEVEKIGVSRAREYLEKSGLALFVIDGGQMWTAQDEAVIELLRDRPALAVLNKSDVPQQIGIDFVQEKLPGVPVLSVSAVQGQGLDDLKGRIFHAAMAEGREGEGAVITNARHAEAVSLAHVMVICAIGSLEDGYGADMASIELREARHALGQITGETADEDVIDRIFERFCLGK